MEDDCGGVVGKGWDEFFELKSKAFSLHRLGIEAVCQDG